MKVWSLNFELLYGRTCSSCDEIAARSRLKNATVRPTNKMSETSQGWAQSHGMKDNGQSLDSNKSRGLGPMEHVCWGMAWVVKPWWWQGRFETSLGKIPGVSCTRCSARRWLCSVFNESPGCCTRSGKPGGVRTVMVESQACWKPVTAKLRIMNDRVGKAPERRPRGQSTWSSKRRGLAPVGIHTGVMSGWRSPAVGKPEFEQKPRVFPHSVQAPEVAKPPLQFRGRQAQSCVIRDAGYPRVATPSEDKAMDLKIRGGGWKCIRFEPRRQRIWSSMHRGSAPASKNALGRGRVCEERRNQLRFWARLEENPWGL
jgi:hypothetical protein